MPRLDPLFRVVSLQTVISGYERTGWLSRLAMWGFASGVFLYLLFNPCCRAVQQQFPPPAEILGFAWLLPYPWQVPAVLVTMSIAVGVFRFLWGILSGYAAQRMEE